MRLDHLLSREPRKGLKREFPHKLPVSRQAAARSLYISRVYAHDKGLQKFGLRIVPVNPSATEILGMRAWPDLESAIQGGGPIDVVDVFRRPEHVAAIVDDCIRLKVPALWLQDGVIDEVAAQKARDAGIFTVMNRCMFRDRSALD